MRQYRNIIINLLFVAVGILFCLVLNPTAEVETESLAIALDDSQYLVTRIYTPKQHKAPYPVMLLCHGVNNSKAMMTPLAIELARAGIAAITFDFRGYGESSSLPMSAKSIDGLERSTIEDAQALLKFIRRYPERFDVNKIGIGGHSLGGKTALDIAQADSQLQATVVLSMSGNATPQSPANLLLGVGVYEQINSTKEVRSTLTEATGEKHPPCINQTGIICGDFANGTARRLVISATTDHVTAPYNPYLIKEVVNWTQQALNAPTSSKHIIAPWLLLASVLTFWSGISAGVCLLVRSGEPALSYPPAYKLFRFCSSWLLGILMLVIGIMARTGLAPSQGASQMMLFCFSLQVISNYLLVNSEQIGARLRVFGLYLCLIMAAFLLPACLPAFPEISQEPRYLLSFPQFVLQWCLFSIYNYTEMMKPYLLSFSTLELRPSWLLLVLIIVELVQPGIILTVGEKIAVWVVNKVRRPLRLSGFGQLTRKKVSIILILLLVWAGVLYQRLADGLLLLIINEADAVLRLVGLLLFLPVTIIFLVVRSPYFCRLEKNQG